MMVHAISGNMGWWFLRCPKWGCPCRIAELAVAEGKAVVLVINKWDLVEDRSQEAMKRAEENVKGNLRHVSWAKCVFTSATEGVITQYRTLHAILIYRHASNTTVFMMQKHQYTRLYGSCTIKCRVSASLQMQ